MNTNRQSGSLREISADLGLRFSAHGQNWGVENSDPLRVTEFIRYFLKFESEFPWDKEELGELILESANDGLLSISVSRLERDEVVKFISVHHDSFPVTTKYWSALAGNSEFPIAQLLKDAVAF
jgi:hypothetical protein